MPTSVFFSTGTRLISLDIRVDEEDWRGYAYDRLEVWRSILGEGGPYEEVSGAAWAPAYIPSPLPTGGGPGPSVNIVGKNLKLLINEQTALEVVFTGTDPLTFAQAAAQIGLASLAYLFAYVSTAGVLTLVTRNPGGLAVLRVVGGDAAPLLGLSSYEPESLAFGHDPRPPLVLGKTQYRFVDYYGSQRYFYKTRFRGGSTVSVFSEPFSVSDNSIVDPDLVVLGYVRVVRPNGKPASKSEVLIFNSYIAQRIAGAVVTGDPQKLLTDDDGYLEFPLLRGTVMDISIGGTPLIRRVTVPTDPTILKFDVFDPLYGVDDNFAVQRAELPYADKKTL